MNGLPLGGRQECERIIQEQGIFLYTPQTGVHYQLSNGIHTDGAYYFLPILELGLYRESFAGELLRAMAEQDIDPRRDIDVLVATGTAAMQIGCTLQHFVGLNHTRLMFVERDKRQIVLGPGFAFRRNERVFLIHLAAIKFRTIRNAIHAIHQFGRDTDAQPCIIGFGVLFDRSPNLKWQKGLEAFKKVSVFKKPITIYRATKKRCKLCIRGVPLVDLRGAT